MATRAERDEVRECKRIATVFECMNMMSLELNCRSALNAAAVTPLGMGAGALVARRRAKPALWTGSTAALLLASARRAPALPRPEDAAARAEVGKGAHVG